MAHKPATRRKHPEIDTDLGKELAYMVIFPVALKASVNKSNRLYLTNFADTYEKLRALKNSLRTLIIGNAKENGGEYRKRLVYKVLCEKLILNIVSGQKKDILTNIEQIMQAEGLEFSEHNHSELSPEERQIIRIDFNGMFPSPSEAELDELNGKYNVSQPLPKEERPFKPEDYNLDELPVWHICRQFSEFRKLEYKIKDAFSEQNIPPEEIKNLSFSDFNYLTKRYIKNHKIAYEGAKSKFVKFFIKHHEQDFRQYMHKNRNIILEALLSKNIEVPKNKKGYDQFVETCIANMKNNGTVPPLFSIHHKIPVKDSKGHKNLNMINSFPNLCIVLDCPYHTMLHMFDTNSKGNAIFNRRVKRLILPPDMVFFGGMSQTFQFYHNYAKAEQKHIKKAIESLFAGKDR